MYSEADLAEHWYLIVGMVLIVCLAGVAYVRRLRQGPRRRMWIDFLLLWPLILDVNTKDRDGNPFTKREWAGWAFVLLIIVLAIIFT